MEVIEAVEAMKQLVVEAVENCTDPNLLDLIYKLLISLT